MRRQSISSPPFLLETFSSTTSAKVPSTPSRKPLKGSTESKTPSKRSIIPTTHLRIHLPSQDLGPHRLQDFRSLHSPFLPGKYRQAPRPFSWIPPLWFELSGSLLQSDLFQLCGAMFFFCDLNGFSTGFAADVAACTGHLAGLTNIGLDKDSVPCRQLHLILAQENPSIHCPHVAKVSTVCVGSD